MTILTKPLTRSGGRAAGAAAPIMRMMMKIRNALILAVVLAAGSGCSDYLDINTNPNAPAASAVTPNLLLAPMIHWMVTGQQYDGRFIGRYTQEWEPSFGATALSTWERMGYDAGSDNAAEQWRDVYWQYGDNLIDMMNKSEAEKRWDLLGVGYVLKAWGWETLTDLHGDIIMTEAFDPNRFTFNYDPQPVVYTEVQALLQKAIDNLARTDGLVDQVYVAKTDRLYSGDRAKWTKFAYGLLALNLNHYSNKSTYNPAAVIAAVDKSLSGNSDDALLTYPAVSADLQDYNFIGWTRNNVRTYRQTQFVVDLMRAGGTLGNTAADPRLTRMLSPSPDGQYRGIDINVAGGGLTAALYPNNLMGYVGTSGGTGLPSRYVFDDKSKFPVMTYAQLQFVKAEAAYRMGDKATALLAYRTAIGAHIDFVNARNSDNLQAPTQISAAEKAAYLADPAIVPATAAGLTLTQIMSQKYIAQWGWGHNELWTDMRRYHYTDMDPASGKQVYPGFAPPTSLFGDNGGKLAYRFRPRYNSDYVWNRPGLETIGALLADYHTVLLWISLP
jgi:hypothetical protein